MKRRQSKQRSPSKIQAGAIGAAISLVVLVLICGIGALALSKEWLPESAGMVFAPLAVGLAALAGPLPLMRSAGKRPLPIAYGHMIGILLLLLLVRTILWSDSEFGGWIVPVSAVAGATLAGFLGGKRKVKRR